MFRENETPTYNKKEFRNRVRTSKRFINLKMKTIGQGKFF